MKKTLLFWVSVCLLFSACEQKKTKRKSTYDGQNGSHIIYYKNSEVVKTEIEYKKQKMDGWYKEYYKDGVLKSEILFKEGLQNGIYKEYYEEGNIKSIRFYKADKQDSVYQQFYRDGKPKSESHFKEGKQTGKLTNYFPSGKVKLETNYRNNEQYGEEKIYYESGKLKSVNYYENGVMGFGGQNFSEDGKPVTADDYLILFEEINQMSISSEYIYRFRLNKIVEKVEMYLVSGELKDGRFLPLARFTLRPKNEYFEHTFYVPRYGSILEVMTVVAVTESKKGQKSITARKLNVALNNFY